MSLSLSVYLAVSVCLSVVRPSVCLSVRPSVRPSVCLSVCMRVRASLAYMFIHVRTIYMHVYDLRGWAFADIYVCLGVSFFATSLDK